MPSSQRIQSHFNPSAAIKLSAAAAGVEASSTAACVKTSKGAFDKLRYLAIFVRSAVPRESGHEPLHHHARLSFVAARLHFRSSCSSALLLLFASVCVCTTVSRFGRHRASVEPLS
jgi:hypothetical protein